MLEMVLFAVGIPDILDGESELNVLIIRAAYFLVCAVMLGYFGAYRESSRERLARLASWPMDAGFGDRRGWLSELCRHAATVTGCESLILIWREQDEPTGFIAHWRKQARPAAAGPRQFPQRLFRGAARLHGPHAGQPA